MITSQLVLRIQTQIMSVSATLMLNPTEENDENSKLKKECVPWNRKPASLSMYNPSTNLSVSLKVVVVIVVAFCMAYPSTAAEVSGKTV